MANINQTSARTAIRPQVQAPGSSQDPTQAQGQSTDAASQDPTQVADPSQTDPTQADSQAVAQSQDPSASGSTSTDATAAPKKSRGLFGGIADVFIGGGQAIGDMVKGVFTVVTHPIKTVEGLGYVVTHPAALVHAFVDPYKQALAEGRPGLALGRGIVEIGSLFVGPGEITGAFKGAKGIITGSRGASEAGDVAGKAGALGAKGAELSGQLTTQAAAVTAKATALQAAGYAGEAAKLNQYARILDRSAALAAKGTDEGVTEAVRFATAAANAQHVTVLTQAGTKVTMSMQGLAEHANALLSGTGKAVATGAVAGGDVAAKTGQVAEWATKLSTQADELEAKAVILGSKGGTATQVAHLNEYAQALRSASQAGTEADAAKLAAAAAQARGLKTAISAANTATKGVSDVGAEAAKILQNAPAAEAGAAAATTGAADASKAAGKAVEVSENINLPVKLTKSASQAVKDLGLSSKQADALLKGADDVFKQQRLGGATQAASLDAAKAYMAKQLGVDSSERSLDALANTLKPSTKFLLNDPKMVSAQFERTNYVRRPLENAANAIGTPIDKSIVAVNHVTQKVGKEVAQTGQRISDAAQRIGDIQLKEIPQAVGQVATWPFRVTYNAAVEAGHTISKGLAEVGDLPVRRLWEVPTEAVRRSVQGAAEFIGRLPNVTLGQIATAPLKALTNPGGLIRPAVALAALGRLGSTQNMPADDASLAKKYGLLDTPDNIAAFKQETASYKDSAIGPDTQDPRQVAQLQNVLQQLGYDVQPTGQFDQNTALAVIDFKQKNGIHQTYKLADGTDAINEYVDQNTAQAMVAAVKGQAGATGDSSNLPQVSANDVQSALDTLGKAFTEAQGAKTDADKQKAKQDVSDAATQAIYALTAYVSANPSAKADARTQMQEIVKGLKSLGFSDSEIQALGDAAQKKLASDMQASASSKPQSSSSTPSAANVPDVSAQQVQSDLDALSSAFDAAQKATTDADKQKTQADLQKAALLAVHDLTAFGLKNPDAQKDVQNQLNEIASALKAQGYSDSDLKALMAAAQKDFQPADSTAKGSSSTTKPSTGTSSTKPTGTTSSTAAAKLASYEAHVAALSDAMGRAQTDKDAKTLAADEQKVLAEFKGAVSDFNDLVGSLPAQQATQLQGQLNQLGTALTQLGFSGSDVANILRSTSNPQATSTVQASAGPGGTYTVKASDTLSRIAQSQLGDAGRWRDIYDLNKQVIGSNPNLILPGQKLKLPGGDNATPAAAASTPSTPSTSVSAASTSTPTATTSTATSTTDPSVAALVKEKGILNTPDNVQAFVAEVGSYKDQGAIGPDSGDATSVKQLQQLLARIGYPVTASGTFDDATANAVIDFKIKNNLHQNYKMADGTYAVNEYVGQDTAMALVAELKKESAGQTQQPVAPASQPAPQDPAADPTATDPGVLYAQNADPSQNGVA